MAMKPFFFDLNTYTPNHLLDTLMGKLHVQSDAGLARALGVPPSTISKIRNKHMAISSSLLLSAHELTEISIRDLRNLMGDVHSKYWRGDLGDDKGGNVVSLPRYIGRHRAKPDSLMFG